MCNSEKTVWALKLQSVILVLALFKGTLGQSQLSTSDYGESDYDDKDVQFDTSPPNLLILLANPENGTTVPLANQPNTDVLLDRSFGKVHLFCSAYYPIKWVYEGDGFPFMNVDNTRFTEDFYDPTSYAFSALLELEGLKESQTGNYSCHKWDDKSFASSFYVYVPGDRVLLPEENRTIYVDSSSTEIVIPCSVSDPEVNVTLLKFHEQSPIETKWIPVSPTLYKFSPKIGFTFSGSSALTSGVGRFQCSVSPKLITEITVILNNTLAGAEPEEISRKCCDKKYLRSLGDERTSCRGFISESCQAPEYLDNSISPCKDWKLTEFLKSPVELCKQEIAPSNSSVGVGYFTSSENGGPRLFMYCQADPKEYTQGFKMAVEWSNGSMVFVDDERHLVPGLSEFPSGYEVHAEITDLLNPNSPLDPLTLHCYIPLKFSFKWIKILREVPKGDLSPFATAWNNSSGNSIGLSTGNVNVRTSVGRGEGDLEVKVQPPLDSNGIDEHLRAHSSASSLNSFTSSFRLFSQSPFSYSLCSFILLRLLLRT